jgi:hypothetical protein
VKTALLDTIELMLRAALPVLVKVMVCAGLVVPVVTDPKVCATLDNDTTGANTTGATPVPLNATVLGELAALVTTLSVAEAAPATVGTKWVVMTQLAAAAKLVPQVCEAVKAGLLNVMALRLKTALPALVKVTVCAGLVRPVVTAPKLCVALDNDTTGAVTTGAAPVPLNATVLGELAALVTKLNVAEAAPAVVGTKWVVMTQLAAAAKLVPQVCEAVKAGLLNVMALRLRAALPVLVKVRVCAGLVVPVVITPKVCAALDNDTMGAVTTGATPVPLSTMVLVPALVTMLRLAEDVPTTVGA